MYWRRRSRKGGREEEGWGGGCGSRRAESASFLMKHLHTCRGPERGERESPTPAERIANACHSEDPPQSRSTPPSRGTRIQTTASSHPGTEREQNSRIITGQSHATLLRTSIQKYLERRLPRALKALHKKKEGERGACVSHGVSAT